MNKQTRTTSLRSHKLTFLKEPSNLQIQTRSQSFKQNITNSLEKRPQESPTKQNSVFLNGSLATRPRTKYNQQGNLSATKLLDSQKTFLLQQTQQQRNVPSPTLHRKQVSDKTLPKISPIKARQLFRQDLNQVDLFRREQPKQNIIRNIYTKSQAGKNEDNITKTNQDSYISIMQFKENMSLFGVCDGHGQEGHKCSQFIRDNLPKQINHFFSPSAAQETLTKAFLKTNSQLCSHDDIVSTFSGSTTVISLIADNNIYTANIGDSRSIICRQLNNGNIISIPLSNDHKPDLPQEKKRIEANGGRVEPYIDFDGSTLGPARVWLKDADIPGLAMSRSFGDKVAASCGVISEPEVLQHQIQDGDLFMVLASDGVWEFLSNEQVVELVYPYYTQDEGNSACLRVVKESVKLWKANDSVIDDITVIIVFFNKQN